MYTRWRSFRVLLYLGMVLIGLLPSVGQGSDGARVYLIKISDAIDKNQANYLERGLKKAREHGAGLVLIQLDTPGGMADAMRDMVQDILASPVPVATYVAPQGARAGSAGAFIAAASHIAAMAPGTNIGASSPVGGGGEDLPKTLASKATNDAAALMRSIAAERGRNADLLEKMVREAASFSATEAVDSNIVDLVALDVNDLLSKIDGRPVRAAGRDVLISTQGVSCLAPRLSCTEVSQSAVERFINVLADPNVASILLTLGGIGLFVELLNPGLVAPGVIGGILLILAFLALGNLPVNWAGVALILLGSLLLLLELNVSGFGILGIGSIISFILGAFLLFAPFSPAPPTIAGPRIHVSPWLIAGVGGAFTLGVAGIGYLAWRGRRAPPATPPKSTLVGMVGRVTTTLNPTGIVYVGGESWSAEEVDGMTAAVGEKVEVVDLDGLKLTVRRIPKLLPSGGEDRVSGQIS